MSILFTSEHGWVISHTEFVKNIYKDVLNQSKSNDYQLKERLFQIDAPFLRDDEKINKSDSQHKKKRKISETDSKYGELREMINFINKSFTNLLEETKSQNIFSTNQSNILNNKIARKLAEECYNESSKETSIKFGSNGNESSLQTINNELYLFPKNCRFYCRNVSEINDYLTEEKFDLILLDPPWWNKYIRRKRKARTNHGYQMMHNIDLATIPVEKMLKNNGLVVIWCTNSPQHLLDLREKVFPVWGVEDVAIWFWVKVTKSGEPICQFSEPPKKQPFEQILFVRRKGDLGVEIPNKKVVVSIPSAINSHKPPLIDLLTPYIGVKSKCLEIFARYLLPDWTSWGLEAIKLQHISLYE